MAKNIDLTIAMISMNEEKAIIQVITDIKKALKEFNGTWEIFIIDSSTDKTAEIAKKMGARVVKQFPPQGYGKAMIRAITEAKGDIVITLDCDNTYPAEAIPYLYSLCKDKYLVVGTNRIWRKSKNMPIGNFLANRFFSCLASIMFLKNAGDIHTGMRAYRKEVIKAMKPYLEPGYAALPVDMIMVPLKMGFKFKDVRIKYKTRVGDVTLNKFDSVKATFKRIFKTRISKIKKVKVIK